MAATKKFTQINKGILVQTSLNVSHVAMVQAFGPLVGKTIENVLIEKDTLSGTCNPLITLQFADGSSAMVLKDPEGNGPGFLEYNE